VVRVATFCHIPLDPAKRAQVAERCTINYMKMYNAKFDPRFVIKRNNADFIRKGGAGGWVDEIYPSLATIIDQRLTQAINRVSRKLSDNEVMSLTCHRSVRGLVVGVISVHSVNRLIRNSTGDVLPTAALVTVGREHLDLGDIVRLRLSLGRANSFMSDAVVVDLFSKNDQTCGVFKFLLATNDQYQ
jgi:hypothetical protein